MAMLYAIISDIHGNLEALTRTLEEIDGAGVDKIICLGDIVGYGANPNECVETVQDRCELSLVGNHDSAACGTTEPTSFNPMARDAVLWTRRMLTEENTQYLQNLPSSSEVENFLIVHGAISHPDRYVHTPYDAYNELKLLEEKDTCFFGHTHVMGYFVLKEEKVDNFTDLELYIEPDAKYFINPGSVGQPRDRNPKASFLFFDGENKHVKFVRLDYDIPNAQRKILDAGLDQRLATRLGYGI
ncbi:MAG: metallophosphoesterase family protein [Candidatus Dadabacteria bacterium]|nr:metallophosphoesterase family protein [Candidatus Dadabacteria bacterium]